MTARIIMKLEVVKVTPLGDKVVHLSFRHPSRPSLPAWTPGAHVDVRLPDGKTRQYSLMGDPDDREHYQIAVQREDAGRGGSRWLHENLHVGSVAHVSAPRNNFPLADTVPGGTSVFVAGGIGITPMMAMIREARQRGDLVELHYCRKNHDPAFLPLLEQLGLGERLVLHVSEDGPDSRLDVGALVQTLPADTHLYCCGPERLTDAVEQAGESAGLAEEQLHFEVFATTLDENYKPEPFELHLASSKKTLLVPADRSALEVLREAGYAVPSSCELGVCGTCECGYTDGVVIHRDAVLRPSARQNRMMLCVSRARVGVTIDL